MSAEPVPDSDLDDFVAEVGEQRARDGQPPFITDPGVYRVLDGIMAGRETTPVNPEVRDNRRRRAVARSRQRVPYNP